MATFTKSVRIYNLAVCPDNIKAFFSEAKKHGLTVLMGIFIGPSAKDNEKELKMMERIMKDYSSVVSAIVVGSDAIVSGKIGSKSRYAKISVHYPPIDWFHTPDVLEQCGIIDWVYWTSQEDHEGKQMEASSHHSWGMGCLGIRIRSRSRRVYISHLLRFLMLLTVVLLILSVWKLIHLMKASQWNVTRKPDAALMLLPMPMPEPLDCLNSTPKMSGYVKPVGRHLERDAALVFPKRKSNSE